MAAPVMMTNTSYQPATHALNLPEKREYCLGPVDSIPIGEGRAFHVGADTIAVFRQRSGKMSAIQNECPHRGGPLSEGILGADTIICPYHAWKTNVETGECLTDPCHIKSYPVRVDGGNVYLRYV